MSRIAELVLSRIYVRSRVFARHIVGAKQASHFANALVRALEAH